MQGAGIKTVAVHSTADADAMHVRLADESVCIGPPPSRDSHRSKPSDRGRLQSPGADAIHPGYGCLPENAKFCRNPWKPMTLPSSAPLLRISASGDKIEAGSTAKRLGIPVVPGSDGRRDG
ncbi:biotin carboxylase N-terminal domain-containing protein [Brucella abortus]|nr:biotin carboxylase N-terminal domain-containing protein [Brucella abortus]